MARIKTDECVAFMRDGRKFRAGELRAEGDTLRSYLLAIATVDRPARTVYIARGAIDRHPRGYSATTRNHLAAATRAAAMLGWTTVEVV